jgi:hypothetical protein
MRAPRSWRGDASTWSIRRTQLLARGCAYASASTPGSRPDRAGVLLSYDATNAQLGHRVSVRELQLYRLVEGKIAERWHAADRRAARAKRSRSGRTDALPASGR